ncbi:alpha-ketoacid dehydrogenase subunit beta [Rhodoplanes sp. TEM]|uniref:Alpha-ketoacid dehydrogenase subunit beta n=1 Tax=Rhodoplanes tepidamans TaxID=200616 RepID=A0ABT5JIN6_RHOTP|nr:MULTISPECIES: alpha-ketoacid dehydrogenase subunit beta [Rhodoplanes]MDC7788885.1 alpha-ketoacid dehydrogenase subunit beta [Rhodoplanes tepidamans]MDC7987506.1 alpha-ketoacid dehydrogenase subunit beta [Rhodoplanes sp. TEM]MDQ0355121.1 pyruvate dehydrogenase E1 component beta subunit [Rhodoplanes tepidamans]
MKITLREAVRQTLAEEMRRDSRVFVLGEDVAAYGGTLQVTAGLFDEFGPDRVFDTPLSEVVITGAAIGSAMMGMRPVLEIMFADFIPLAFDQILNNAAKMCYAYDGEMSVPMVLRAPFGGGMRSGMHHCQNLEAMFAHVPGIKVVMPTTPEDAKGLLLAAIRDPNPVIYLEHKMLYGARGEVPDGDHVTPIGKAAIRREGRDLTIVACGALVGKALQAAKELEKTGVEAEVVDLRTISPLDKDTILDSVIKTSRLLVAHEACKTGGIGAEIAAIVAEHAIDALDAPIERVAAPDCPVPFSASLEDAFLPQPAQIVAQAKRMLGRRFA